MNRVLSQKDYLMYLVRKEESRVHYEFDHEKFKLYLKRWVFVIAFIALC